MKDFNDLQNLWKEQKPAALPDVKNILAEAKKVQRQLNNKITTQIVILVAVVIFIMILVNIIPFKEVTTFAGIGLMALSILAFSAARLYQVLQLKKMDLTQHPRQLLFDLETYLQFQKKVNSDYTFAYFVVMNIAFGLYFIEVLRPLSMIYKSFIIIIYVAWMLFAVFYLRKKHQLKEQAKIQSIIDAVTMAEKHYES